MFSKSHTFYVLTVHNRWTPHLSKYSKIFCELSHANFKGCHMLREEIISIFLIQLHSRFMLSSARALNLKISHIIILLGL